MPFFKKPQRREEEEEEEEDDDEPQQVQYRDENDEDEQGGGNEEEEDEDGQEGGDEYNEDNEREVDQEQDEDEEDQEDRGDEEEGGEEDEQEEGGKSSTVHIDFNLNLDLDHESLHKGGTTFSKKLLAQLFSGPGEHDPHEKEVGVHNIQHEHVETSDTGEWTIVELQAVDSSGATIYLKAKLDSGADDNFMSFDIYEVTGLDFTPYEGPEGPPSFTTGSGADTSPIGTVQLAYTAGVKPQRFVETFQVLEGLPHDVIIGKPLMTSAHMIMVDPNFAHPPEHKKLALLELPPKQKDSKAKALAFQKQRAAEQQAAYEAKLKEQEKAAPKSSKKSIFGKFGKH